MVSPSGDTAIERTAWSVNVVSCSGQPVAPRVGTRQRLNWPDALLEKRTCSPLAENASVGWSRRIAKNCSNRGRLVVARVTATSREPTLAA